MRLLVSNSLATDKTKHNSSPIGQHVRPSRHSAEPLYIFSSAFMGHAGMEQQLALSMKKGIELSANVESELKIRPPKNGHTDSLHQD